MHTYNESGGNGVPAFLAKLWRLVEDPETNNLIYWSKDGHSFIIQNQAQFARELLPLNYKHNNMLAKERAMKEVEKVSLVRAKIAKIKNRPGRLNAVAETVSKNNASATRKRKSKFADDLTDVSRSGAKRLRNKANKHKKMKVLGKKKASTVKLTNKAGKNKFNKGKNFGGPRFGKKK